MATRPEGLSAQGGDLFMTAVPSKTAVFEGEPVLLTYKIYALPRVVKMEGTVPDFKGFLAFELETSAKKDFKAEKFNGRSYQSVVWSQYVLMPVESGELHSPRITYSATVSVEQAASDPIDNLLDGGNETREFVRAVEAPSASILVKPLPAAPENFTGGVGTFSLTANPDTSLVKLGETFRVKVTVAGAGNMKFQREPTLRLPSDFENFGVTVKENTRLTAKGYEGDIEYDFLSVPKNLGKYTIPPVELCYFDTEEGQYKTLTTEAFTLEVEKEVGSIVASKRLLPTQTEDAGLKKVRGSLLGNWPYILSIVGFILIFLLLYRQFRRYNSVALQEKRRIRKARRFSAKAIHQAKTWLQKGDDDNYYQELLQALSTFVADTFAMETADLSDENIRGKLIERRIDEALTTQFLSIFGACKQARYAPESEEKDKGLMLESAAETIEEIAAALLNPPRG